MLITLESVTSLAIFHYILVLTRMGAMLALLPGFGTSFVPVRVRLLAAFAISFVLFPVLSTNFPNIPSSGIGIALMILAEAMIGFFIGAVARLLQSVLHTTGMLLAFVSSLAAAQLFDATQGSQGSVFSSFLTMTGITLFLATDLHHLMITGMADSYKLYAPGTFMPPDDMAVTLATMLSASFTLAMKIAAPQVVIGVSMYLAAGIMGRLMPQMQVFFVLVPLQILVSFNILLITLAIGMGMYINHFEASLDSIFYP